MFFLCLLLVSSCFLSNHLLAQKINIPELKIKFDDKGNNFLKFNISNQVWLRYIDLNPGSQLDGYNIENSFDIGLRRTRFQATGQFDRVLLYVHIGQNNFSFNTARKQGIFIHDALGELALMKDKFYIGAGLTGWGAFSRGSLSSTTQILTMDVPIQHYATLDISDQFLRKLAVYAKGLVGKFNYRLAIAKPMTIKNSNAQSEIISERSLFSNKPSHLQIQGYLMYHFWEKESNASAYLPSTYHGEKQIFNLGIGFLHQNNAMWHYNAALDTIEQDLNIINVDAFLEYPLNSNKANAITVNAAYTYTNYGKDYIRNVGVMNPANGVNHLSSFNGIGNAYPMMGTGHNIMFQLGYLFRKDLLKDWGTLQPYFALQYGQFDALKNAADTYHLGLNWLISNSKAKISLHYENRPIFTDNGNGEIFRNSRKGMLITQLQIAL